MNGQLLTTADAAAQLGVTPARIRQLVLSGEIKAEKVGRDVLIPVAEIETAKARKTKPGPAPKKPDESQTKQVAETKPAKKRASKKG